MAGPLSMSRILLVTAIVMLAVEICVTQVSQYSDDFENAATLSDWTTLSSVEGWPDRFEELSIDSGNNGVLRLMPHTSTWYMRKVGGFIFKEIPPGDFTVQTRAHVESRAGGSTLPSSTYSLAGLFVRTPTNWTTWQNQGSVDIADCSDPAGYENYVFISLGRGTGSTWQIEVKTTIDSCSDLYLVDANTQEADLQLTRLGDYIILVRRFLPNGAWTVHEVYPRTDMNNIPALQVGFVAYTDYGFVGPMHDEDYNSDQIQAGDTSADGHPNAAGTATPDIVGEFEFAEFCDVVVPSDLQGITDWTTASHSDILRFLGGNAACSNSTGITGGTASAGDGSSSSPASRNQSPSLWSFLMGLVQ